MDTQCAFFIGDTLPCSLDSLKLLFATYSVAICLLHEKPFLLLQTLFHVFQRYFLAYAYKQTEKTIHDPQPRTVSE